MISVHVDDDWGALKPTISLTSMDILREQAKACYHYAPIRVVLEGMQHKNITLLYALLHGSHVMTRNDFVVCWRGTIGERWAWEMCRVLVSVCLDVSKAMVKVSSVIERRLHNEAVQSLEELYLTVTKVGEESDQP